MKKGPDTITIPNASGSTQVSKKQQDIQDQQEEPLVKSDGNEVEIYQIINIFPKLKKRDDKKKMAKIAAVGDSEEIFENIAKKEK